MFAALRLAAALLVLIGPFELEPSEPPGRLSADEVFEGDSATLTPAGEAALALWISWLKAKPDMVASVEVHTDSRGGAKANFAASRARAEAVVAHLRAGGIPLLRAMGSGRGEGTPLADNSTAGGRAKNRRVEIRTRPLAEVHADLARILDKPKPKPAADGPPAAKPPAPGAELLANGKKTIRTKEFGAWTARQEVLGRRVGDANAAFDLTIAAGVSLRVVVVPSRADLDAAVTLRSPSGRVVKGTKQVHMGTAKGAWYPWAALAGAPEEPGRWRVEIGGKPGQIVEVRLQWVEREGRAPRKDADGWLCDRLDALRAHYLHDDLFSTVPTGAPRAGSGDRPFGPELLILGARDGGWSAQKRRLEWMLHSGKDQDEAARRFEAAAKQLQACRREEYAPPLSSWGQMPGAPRGVKARHATLLGPAEHKYEPRRTFRLMQVDASPNHLVLMTAAGEVARD